MQQGAIDAWAQPVVRALGESIPEIENLFRASGSLDMLDGRQLDPTQTVDLMDQAGMRTLMLCAWHRPEGWLITNDQIAEFTQAYPDRFVGVAAVDLARPVQAQKELERAVHDLGFRALRVVPWLWKLPPNANLYYPLYAKCIELDIPFCTQVGHTGPLMPSEVGRPVPYLDEVALAFPELRIVAGHIGFPWTDEMIGVAWKHKNVYIDTSAWLPRYYPPSLMHYLATYGKEKVLFGTNFPQLSFQACLDQVRALGLDQEVEDNFLYRNAQRVFNLT